MFFFKTEQEILDLFSRITSSVDDVFSAQVPKKLSEICEQIQDKENFLKLSNSEAIQWLKENNQKFNEFLAEFGHRGYKEFDLYALQWEQDPTPLINSLRSMLANKNVQNDNGEGDKVSKSYDLDKYSDLSFLQRKILEKFIIPKTHLGIRDRELCKNLLIKTYNQFRKAFYSLGEKLVEEGKIPNRELVFFLRNHELKEMVESERNPLVVLNAKNRLRLHPKKDSLKFGEITSGYDLKPRNWKSDNVVATNGKITGVPISSGRIVARCCVAETLEEAKNIQVS